MVEGPVTPTGTGAVPGPPATVTLEQTPGHPVGTGAVEPPPAQVVHEFGPAGSENPTGFIDNPGPVTTKVVIAPPRAKPNTTTGETAETADRQPRHAHPDPKTEPTPAAEQPAPVRQRQADTEGR